MFDEDEVVTELSLYGTKETSERCAVCSRGELGDVVLEGITPQRSTIGGRTVGPNLGRPALPPW